MSQTIVEVPASNDLLGMFIVSSCVEKKFSEDPKLEDEYAKECKEKLKQLAADVANFILGKGYKKFGIQGLPYQVTRDKEKGTETITQITIVACEKEVVKP